MPPFRLRTALLVACTCAPLIALDAQPPAPRDEVTIVVDSPLAPPPHHSVSLLRAALEAKGLSVRQRARLPSATTGKHLLVIGDCAGSPAIETLVRQAGAAVPRNAESLLVQRVAWNGASAVAICGADDRGLMYAVYDIADQVRLAPDAAAALARIPNAAESPDVAVRSVTRMLMNRAVVEEYFYSEEYWDAYLTMLARNRYNTFTLMMGYGAAGYFEPPYPFLFDVPEFPVEVVGLTAGEQQKNLRMLNRIIEMTHARGLDFTLALWTHIFVPGHNNNVSAPRPGLPTGLTEDNLVPYTRVALAKLLQLVPDIDRLQFRVHVESSVTLPQQKRFWGEVFKVLEAHPRRIPVDMRLKGLSDDLIEAALASPLEVRLATKHWGEELGLPYHPTQDTLANKYERRHTYADVLTYPRRYDILWRLWSHGTVKVLLWGSPDHARRFAESTHLYDGAGFDLHEPLAMKMGYKRGLHDQKPYEVLSARYRHYRWEFERYWHFYQLFGRLGYNPRTPRRVWQAEFEDRFGAAAAPFVERAYAIASNVLPRIVAYATRDLSAGFTWPEKQRWEDLPEYVEVEPSDPAQFLGIDEAARFIVSGTPSAKIGPEQNSRWFEQVSHDILAQLREAERRAGDQANPELAATLVDMRVLAGLAAYHARRLQAGLSYALARHTGDLYAFDEALEHERAAISAWRTIVELTDGVYPDDIIMGAEGRMTGSWKTELVALEQGLTALERERARFRVRERVVVARIDAGDGPVEPGFQPLTSTQPYAPGSAGWHHRNLEADAGLADSAPKERYRDFVHGPPPDAYTDSSFGVAVPNGEYELLFSMVDRSPASRDHGPMWLVAEGKDATPRFSVPAGQLVEKRLRTRVVDGRLDVLVSSTTDGDWIFNSLIVTRVEPAIGHVPIRRVSGARDVVVRATITGPDPIRSAQVVYGSAATGYERLTMTTTAPSQYQAVVPRSELVDGFRYFITTVDAGGRRASLPRQAADHPFGVAVTTDSRAPTVAHDKVARWSPGTPLTLSARVSDESGVGPVYVRYRSVSQHQDFHRVRMLPTGRPHEYQVEIPGDDLDGRWDFMYYIEAFDTYGNGRIHPDLETETPYVVVDLHSARRAHGTHENASLKR